MKPKSLENLSISIKSLLEIIKKQSKKLACNILIKYIKETENFFKTFNITKNKIQICNKCGNLLDEYFCKMCQDDFKNRENTLIIVENSLDVFKFEESSKLKCYYHVLNGLLDVSEKNIFNKLNIKNLKTRSKKFKEIIFALSLNLEGMVTSNYIKKFLDNDKKITQLTQGMSMGTSMEYVDKLTLQIALENRRKFK